MEVALLLAILAIGFVAGILGSLFGIGGGILIIPALTILFGLTATQAAAASLVGIVATSVGGTVFYLDNKMTNVRLGLFLEISTVIGAIIGVVLAGMMEQWIIMSIFTVVIALSALKMIINPKADIEDDENGEFVFRDNKTDTVTRYSLKHKWAGFAGCSVAGIISSLTGVGGGVIKVPMMNMVMGVPMKAATSTSSYMIGITAFSGAIMYFIEGTILLDVAAFIALGTFAGAMIGSRISRRFDGSAMKKYFAILQFFIVIVMILQIGGIL